MNSKITDIVVEMMKIRRKKEADIIKVVVTTNYDGSKEVSDDEVEIITTLKIGVVTNLPTTFPNQEQTDFEIFIDKGICKKERFNKYCELKRKELSEFKIDLFESVFRNIGCPIVSTYDLFNTWDYEI